MGTKDDLNSNGVETLFSPEILLLLERLQEQNGGLGGGGTSHRTVTETTVEIHAGPVYRVEGENISYGNPIEVDINNINSMGFRNNIVTYAMDENGNFIQEVDGLSTDRAESSPEEFLAQQGGGLFSSYTVRPDQSGTPVVSGHEDSSFKMQRVEVDGENIGYYIYFEDHGNDMGLYIGPDALDLDQMDPNLKEELAKPGVEEPGLSEPSPAFEVNDDPNLNNTAEQSFDVNAPKISV